MVSFTAPSMANVDQSTISGAVGSEASVVDEEWATAATAPCTTPSPEGPAAEAGSSMTAATVTAAPSPVGVDANILLATNSDSSNNNNNNNNKRNADNAHISKKQRKQRLQQFQVQKQHLQKQQQEQQQQQLRRHQLHQQHQLPGQQPIAGTATPDAGTVTPALPETSTPADASRAVAKCPSTSRRSAHRKGDRFAIANKFSELEESESEVDVESIGAVNVPEAISRTETYSHTPTPLTPPQPAGPLIGVVSSEPQASEAAGLAAWMPRLGVSTATARYLQQQQPQQQPRQPPLDAVCRRQECTSLNDARIISKQELASLNDAGIIRDYNNNDNYNYSNNDNFKTRRCIHHDRGTCSYGLQCSFARSQAELFYNNNNFKPVMCKNLMGGTCRWVLQCRFAHSEPELPPNNNNSVRAPLRSSRKQWVVVTPIAEQQQQLQPQQTIAHSQSELSPNNNSRNNNNCRAAPVGRSRKQWVWLSSLPG
ncbi:unnamed protein product [Polarella glacialis]|uniref:C3H1-type domain-containing protein n=1 Tax=Polarella glacialis TaxID=89957 RepID=A0A813E594_POLGL|nr:unnamed protein product [Polarella glacialis]